MRRRRWRPPMAQCWGCNVAFRQLGRGDRFCPVCSLLAEVDSEERRREENEAMMVRAALRPRAAQRPVEFWG